MRKPIVSAVLAAVAVFLGASAHALATAAAPGPVTLQLTFQRAGSGVFAALGSKNYMLALLDDGGAEVYNDARGAHWRIRSGPCGTATLARPEAYSGMFGAPWIVFYCTREAFALYNVVTRRWHAVGGASVQPAFRDAAYYEAGAAWIKLVNQGGHDCGDHIHFGCGETVQYYSIASKSLVAAPTLGTGSFVDLDSPQLVHQLCPPVQSPPSDMYGTPGGSAVLRGVVLESNGPQLLNNFSPETATGDMPLWWRLQRCGSSRQLTVETAHGGRQLGALTANSTAVLWSNISARGIWHGGFSGRFLPSLRSFNGSVPNSVAGDTSGPTLDSSHIYVRGSNGTLWRAAFPAHQ